MKKTNRTFAEAYDVVRPFLAAKLQDKEYDLIIDFHRDSAGKKTTTITYGNETYGKLGTAMEGFTDAVIDAVKKENVEIINATENIDFISGQEEANHEEEDGQEGESEEEHDEHTEKGLDLDPHVWLDPNRSILIAENIKNALIKISPENKVTYERNFNLLKHKGHNTK